MPAGTGILSELRPTHKQGTLVTIRDTKDSPEGCSEACAASGLGATIMHYAYRRRSVSTVNMGNKSIYSYLKYDNECTRRMTVPEKNLTSRAGIQGQTGCGRCMSPHSMPCLKGHLGEGGVGVQICAFGYYLTRSSLLWLAFDSHLIAPMTLSCVL